jgi:hypothetical protein
MSEQKKNKRTFNSKPTDQTESKQSNLFIYFFEIVQTIVFDWIAGFSRHTLRLVLR